MKPGIWLLASLNSHGTTKGMRVKFQDVECYRDYQYEYSDYDDLAKKEFNVWNPQKETIQKNEKEPELEKIPTGEIDAYTEMFANELGLRSLKQQSNSTDVDLLDLSFLDYEVVDVSNDTEPHFTKTKNKTFTAEINRLKNNSLPVSWKEGQNLTGVDFLNQLIIKNLTTVQNSSASAFEEATNLTETLKNLTTLDSSDNMPADGIKTSFSAPKHNAGKNSSIDGQDVSSQKAHGSHLNSSEKVTPFISNFIIDAAGLFKNGSATANLSTSNTMNNEPDIISSPKQTSNETVEEIVISSSEEFGHLESSEEVFIFVKDKNTGIIKTTSVKTPGHNWTYDGTHQIVPMEIADDVKRYFEKSLKTQQKKMRKVTVPHRPQNGQAMKTKRRKDYAPKAKSGLPFSPRGFNPSLSPRGARPQGLQPVNDEEKLINNPVVIGVPRPDFSDYQLYLPGDEPDHLGLDEQNVKANEYEYVSYKDPYSSDDNAKNFHLDQANKLKKNTDKNVKTYFIAAKEVFWDYAGYGHR